ncbi:hypothetical protein [Piscinibacter sp.]|uniref:hypothetical protein n=1 Tax=Piscinibacter sp. TaxID=1903157 RepID=UPI0039E686B3
MPAPRALARLLAPLLVAWPLIANAAEPDPLAGVKPCAPSGKGTDYQVGPGPGQLATLDDVPWERLGSGDTVRIFARPQPYRGKILVAGRGTPDAPVRVCGVRDDAGRRPVIDGNGAQARRGLAYGHPLHEARSVVLVNRLGSQAWQAFPENVVISGLHIRGAHPDNGFTDSKGQPQRYEKFGACVWIERGDGVTIADNEISDCSQGIFSRSTMDGDFAVTKRLRVAGNHLHDNGIAGSDREHAAYVQSVDVVYEFNRFGRMRDGAGGNAIKDRSVGAVVRYNRIEDGARAIDLVEAEDYADVARQDPRYRETFVYGNVIVKDGRKGSTIHYGGDHAGSEDNYRKGTLYFFHNTVRLTGDGYGVLFQLSTTQETAQVWNNVFLFDATIPHPRMRDGQDNAPGIESGGIVRLDRNWIVSRWSDAGPWHKVGGQLHGASRLLSGARPPVDAATLKPIASSPLVGAGVVGPESARLHEVKWQIGPRGEILPRNSSGNSGTLGALEP